MLLMNDVEIIFKNAGLSIPYNYLIEQYHNELKELLLEELAYFVCRDSLPKLMNNTKNTVEKDNSDLKGRIINKTNFFGYLLYKSKDMANTLLKNTYQNNQITYTYHNPISNTDRFLSDYEISLYFKIKNQLSKNISEREAINQIIKIEQNKLVKLNDKVLKLKNKAHNANIENLLDDLTITEKQLYLMIRNNQINMADTLKLLNQSQYTIKNIKELHSCVMQADIPEEFYFLNLQKSLEQQSNNVQEHIYDLQRKENLSFKKLTGLQIYQKIEEEQKKQNFKNYSYIASSLLYSFGIKGLYNPVHEYFVVFNPNDIKNIKIVN